ncbi:MAG TPA: GNAT family N-acetyltransferase [Candidatus Bathyarchaeia archaeon]|nr:GNAT family N-acetyltransferase [Candidatus Bathyarchaeia archaeon]
MEIVLYRDLESRSGLLPLLEQAFGWPFNEREFNRLIKIDPRLKNGAVGFCALENGRVVSYVGAMDLATRTLDGAIERAGGIYGVATLPGYTHQGYSTALLRATHEYFKGKGYRFSFLNTSPTIIAYSVYKKLGYSDVYSCPSVYKVLNATKATLPIAKSPKPDLDKVLAIYNDYVKDKVGLVVRDRAYLELLAKDKWLTSKRTICTGNGYVVFKKEQYSTAILELVARNRAEAEELLKTVESKAGGSVFARAVFDKAVREIYLSRGYTFLNEGHGVFMVKPLEKDAHFKQVYGDNFFQTRLV